MRAHVSLALLHSLCPGLWRYSINPRPSWACCNNVAGRDSTTEADIWGVGGDRWVDGGPGPGTSPMPAPLAQPWGPWGWHRALSLAAVPTRQSRPSRVSECQILGSRLASALSRASLTERPVWGRGACWGGPLPLGTRRASGLRSSQASLGYTAGCWISEVTTKTWLELMAQWYKSYLVMMGTRSSCPGPQPLAS